MEPSVATLPADKNVPDSLQPTVGSPLSTPDSNVYVPEPVPMVEETPARNLHMRNLRMRGHDACSSLQWYYRITT